VMLALPALVALPAASVKFTELAERLSVSDSASEAFRVMVCAPELIACAEAIVVATASPSAIIAIRKNLPVFIDQFSPKRIFFVSSFSSAVPRACHRIRKVMNHCDYWEKLIGRKLTEVMLTAQEFVQCF